MKLDLAEFRSAVKAVKKQTGRDIEESLNRSMGSILFKSRVSLIKRTQRQTKAGVIAELKKGDLLARMATKWLGERGREITPFSVAAAMQKIVTARVRSIRYLVAGWIPAAIDFGASRFKRPGSGSVAARGGGKKATAREHVAEATNAVASVIADRSVHNHTYKVIQSAIDHEADGMVKYLEKKMAKTMGRHSGGK